MHLQNIRLLQFKNYKESYFDFAEGINCIIGPNGVGKTNLLDAIYYLAFTKSAFNAIDKENVLHNENLFSIKGHFLKNNKSHQVLCAVKFGDKKVVKWDKAEYEKISSHIGKIPLVFIAPQDSDIIEGGSEIRRKFFDNILSQLSQEYLQLLLQYNQLLKQRNALLKRFAEDRRYEPEQLEPYNNRMIPLSIAIAGKRNALLSSFLPVFNDYYQQLSQGKEVVDIQYTTRVNSDFRELLLKKQSEDAFLGRTTVGVHKDDFAFLLKDKPIKKYGSQGQQKSFLISLKLAQFTLLKNERDEPPLLLLDDIFDKLDDQRIAYLLKLMQKGTFGQVFLTDARPERSRSYMQEISVKASFLELKPE